MYKGWHTQGDWSLQLVPETYPRKSLHEGIGPTNTVHMKRFEEQVAAVICPKLSNWFKFLGLVARTKALDFEAKMAGSWDGSCPSDLLQVLVTGAIVPSWVPILNTDSSH